MGYNKLFRRTAVMGLFGTSKWRGITNIVSGASIVTVSLAGLAVNSGKVPHLTLGETTVASHRAIILSCNSVVANTSFCVVADKATSGGSQQVVYSIVN